MTSLQVDVIAPIPQEWGLCATCQAFLAQAELDKNPVERSLDSFPPDWMEDFKKLSSVILDISENFGDQILIRVYDPRSLQGMLRSLRYRVTRYPTFVVKDFGKVAGLQREKINRLLESAGCQKAGAG